jgi:hypothetical protein
MSQAGARESRLAANLGKLDKDNANEILIIRFSSLSKVDEYRIYVGRIRYSFNDHCIEKIIYHEITKSRSFHCCIAL